MAKQKVTIKKVSLYGIDWPADFCPLERELYMIRKGGQWVNEHGNTIGLGLFDHYRNAQSIAWPDDDHHRWSDLTLRRFLENEIVILMGSGDSSKTYNMSRLILIDWWAFPEETLWLISSTDYRGAELRIWGKVKELFNRARKLFPALPGHPLDSMRAISTQDIADDETLARSLQRGLIVVPNKKGNVNVGLSAYVGVKAPRLRHAGDEVQLMTPGFLDAYSNWYGKENFKGVMAGNPLDMTDQLCSVAEPEGGWESYVDTGKTQEWRSNFFGAWVIALDGRDSPNNDFPGDKPAFPYLINKKKLDAVRRTHGEDSWQWFSQCIGKPNKGLDLWRVITSKMCNDGKAFDDPIWQGTQRDNLLYLDPAYGGGDRCVAGRLEFGQNIDEVDILYLHPQEIIPINLRMKEEPEEQIAAYMLQRSKELNIPAKKIFWDSFGKGTLGFYFAKVFGNDTPVPINSGDTCTDRPVRFDLFVEERENEKRHKRCDEHYRKFVTEMWFSVSEAVQSGQIRGLTKEAAREGYARIYSLTANNLIEVESKEDYKERMRKSPDLFDGIAVGVEGARRLGFKIQRLGKPAKSEDEGWFDREAAEYEAMIQNCLLKH